jgi:hypothetical protein
VLKVKNWKELTRNRKEWNKLVEKAKTNPGCSAAEEEEEKIKCDLWTIKDNLGFPINIRTVSMAHHVVSMKREVDCANNSSFRVGFS